MRKLKNIKSFYKNKTKITTVGLIYKSNTDQNGEWFLDDYGDKHFIESEYFEEV